MISRNYEVLVVDPSPGALVAAALLARAGLSVLVLDPEEAPGRVGPFRFTRHRPPVVGFTGGLLLPRTLKALKFHPHELQALRKGTPGLQVISNRHRLDLHSSPEAMDAEFRREYPRQARELGLVLRKSLASAQSFAAALERATEEAGQVGLLQSVGLQRPKWNPPLPPEDVPTWGEFIDESDLRDSGRLFLRGMLRPFCSLDVVEDLPLPVAGIHLAAALDGAFSDPGEEDPLLTLLLRRVRAMRVDVLPAQLERLEGNRRRVERAVFEGSPDPMPLELVVTGGDPEDLLPLLPGKPRAYQRVLSQLAPSHFRYSIYIGVRGEVIPPDLAEHAVLLDDEDPDGEAGCLLLSTSPPDSPLAPGEFRSLTLSTLLPYTEDGQLPGNLEGVAAAMLDRVKWLMPFLERHIEVLHVPTLSETVDGEAHIAIDPRPVAYTPAIPPAEDPVAAGLGVYLPHRNVFCAGPAAFPALGLGGEGLAGRLVERVGLAGLKRSE